MYLLQTETMDRTEFKFTTTYGSPTYKRGTYKMDITVYKQEFIFPIPQGSASTLFDITGWYKYKQFWKR